MSATYEPGDVMLAKYRGEPPKRFMYQRQFGTKHYHWVSAEGTRSVDFSAAEWTRPLVVIDPDGDEIEKFCDCGSVDSGHDGDCQMWRAQAIFRSLVAPPKPEEPTGLGAVVEDAEGEAWSRRADGAYVCLSAGPELIRTWSNLDAVRVIFVGVTQ